MVNSLFVTCLFTYIAGVKGQISWAQKANKQLTVHIKPNAILATSS